MSFRARQPGCPCCDDDCRIDITGWNQVAGTWTITGDNLETSSSSALAVTTNEHPESKSTHYVSVKVKGDDDGDVLRVIVAFDTIQDYLYAELEVGDSTGYVRLFQVVGGATFQLGDTVSGPNLKPGNTYTMRVCYANEILTLHIVNRTLVVRSVSATGTHVGVATGAITSLATFSDFQWWIHYDDGSEYYDEPNDCPWCGLPCSACVKQEGPTVYAATFTWIPDPMTTPVADCTVLGGTYLVPVVGTGTTGCIYYTLFPSNVFGMNDDDWQEYTEIKIEHEVLSEIDGTYKTSVEFFVFRIFETLIEQSVRAYFRKEWSGKIQCMEFDNQDVPFIESFGRIFGTIPDCGPPWTATCKLTAL